VLRERCQTVDRPTQLLPLLASAITARLDDVPAVALAWLGTLAAREFITEVEVADRIAEWVRFSSIRVLDPTLLGPLLREAFRRATDRLRQACACGHSAAKGIDDAELSRRIATASRLGRSGARATLFREPEEYGVRRAFVDLNRLAFECSGEVDHEVWGAKVDEVATADGLNPFLVGQAVAVMVENGRISEDELGGHLRRRLGPGVALDRAAGWLEGLMSYNRMALLARLGLWRQLDLYLDSLGEEAFRSVLVVLRQAFGAFDQSEICRVVSNLVEISDEASGRLKESADVKLDEDEAKKLQDLLGDLSF
jgi:hypothetical protein